MQGRLRTGYTKNSRLDFSSVNRCGHKKERDLCAEWGGRQAGVIVGAYQLPCSGKFFKPLARNRLLVLKIGVPVDLFLARMVESLVQEGRTPPLLFGV